jgi:hypothetical protein
MAFLGTALLQNIRVLLHTDNADDKHGFVIMTPFGKFTGGHLLLGSWTIQCGMEYQQGNLVIFNSGIFLLRDHHVSRLPTRRLVPWTSAYT